VKKLFIAVVAMSVAFVLFAEEASATENSKTIVVIDSGIDTTHKALEGKIVHEVCILDFAICPNNQKVMEGPGAATLDPVRAANNSFYHGTQMASVVIANNPNAKIVFIRIVPMTPKGGRASVSTNAMGNALKWVVENKDKHNIAVVSVSMGLPNKTSSCASNSLVESSIVSLKDSGIPSIFANGNSGKYDRVDFPACFAPSIAVGGADFISKRYFPALYSNNSTDTDFFAYGKTRDSAMPNNKTGIVIGSSVSTALLASKWLMLSNQGLSYQEAYDTINSHSVVVSTKKVSNAKVFNHELVN
jgi:subtilisin family serine protease